MDFNDFDRADPDFIDRVGALTDELGLRTIEYYLAISEAKDRGELSPIFAETADEWLTKKREVMTAWKAEYDAQDQPQIEDGNDYSPWG